MLDGDHGHLAAAARDLRQGAAFEIAQQFGGAVRLSHEQRPEPVLLLKRPGQPVEARPAPSKLAELQLLERLRHLMAANRHDIVHDGVAAPGEPTGPGVSQAPLGFELNAGEEQRRVDQGAEAARRVRRAHERLHTFELGDVGLVRLRQHQRNAALPPTDRAQRQDAPIVDPDPEPAAHAAPAQRPVGRVEVDVALKERLHRSGTEAQGERVRYHAVQKVEGRDLALPLRRHA